MSQVNNNSSVTSIMDSINLGPTQSLQMLFAKLNLAQAQLAKNGAMENINKIQKSQEAQKECATMIAKARDLQNQAKTSGKAADMPPEMVTYFDKNGLKYDTKGNDVHHNKDEWEYNIQSLTAFRDQLGTDTQQLMVFVQDFMGQYNSYLQGANSAIQQGNQTLQTLASGR
ncbi:hypothetical protein FVW20_04720 [Desulfovibrio oxamicus]|uniref:Uncharacterized protein n=1 Tax=Nitratidesulfovibrio oxamicus TaxID=32016 RepID=A0ABS0J2Z7_9BACT|nr:hypothetical protein [Nitratidesulfovibrio oxamicus]MBG3876346.1 hypothetical protein [Nitratidesulfovibrio oxamicus]